MSEASYFLKRNGKIERVDIPYNREGDNTEWENIPSSQFLTIDEIVDHQLSQLPADTRQEFKDMAEEDLISLHFGYGMWIRNNYGLWHPNHPSVIKDDMGDGHPDGCSQRAIEKMHKRLQQTNIAYEDAMNIVEDK